jgi:hypothetical protein
VTLQTSALIALWTRIPEMRHFWPHFGDATGFPAITITLTLVLATALMWLS